MYVEEGDIPFVEVAQCLCQSGRAAGSLGRGIGDVQSVVAHGASLVDPFTLGGLSGRQDDCGGGLAEVQSQPFRVEGPAGFF